MNNIETENLFYKNTTGYNQQEISQQKADSSLENTLFFDMLQTDRVLRLCIETFEMMDKAGNIKETYSNFKHPPLTLKTIKAIKNLFVTHVNIPPLNPQLPTLSFLPLKALQRQKQEVIKNQKIKQDIQVFMCGSRLLHELGEETVLAVFEAFITQYKLAVKPKELFTTSFKEKLKSKGKDVDVQSKIFDGSLEDCVQIADILIDELKEKIPDLSQMMDIVSEQKKDLLEKYLILDLLKAFLKEEYLTREPRDGYQISKNSEEKDVYSNRTLGGFDFTYFTSQTKAGGLSSIDSLRLDITPLLDERNDLAPPFDPNSQRNVLQYYLDHNHDLYRIEEGIDINKKDFLRILEMVLNGKRCWVKGTNQKILQSLIKTIKSQNEDLITGLLSIIQKADCSDLDRLLGLSYLFLSALAEQELVEKSILRETQKKILSHLEDIKQIHQNGFINLFLEEIQAALQDPHIYFEDVSAFLQLLGYIGLHVPEIVTASFKVILTSHDQKPHIQIQCYHQGKIHLNLLLGYEPDQALSRILAIKNSETVQKLNRLFKAFLILDSQLITGNFSPIKKHAHSSLLKLQEVRLLAQQLATHENLTESLWGQWIIYACLKQEFHVEDLAFFLKLSISNPLLLKSATIQNLHTLYQQYQKELSSTDLFEFLINLLKLKEDSKNLFAKELYEKLEIDLLDNVEFFIKDDHAHFIFEFIKLLPALQASKWAIRLQTHPYLSAKTKFNILLRIADLCCQSKDVKLISKIATAFCTLLQGNDLDQFENVFSTQEKFEFLIKQLIQTEVKIAYDFLKLGLQKQFISPQTSTATISFSIARQFLSLSVFGMILADNCWTLIKKHQLDKILPKSAEKFAENFYRQASYLSSGQQQTLKESFSKESKSLEKHHYLIWLDEIKKDLTLNSSKNFTVLFESFISIIQRIEKEQAVWEKEKDLIDLLLFNFLKENQIKDPQCFVLKNFLKQLNQHYQSSFYNKDLIQTLLDRFFKSFQQDSTVLQRENTLKAIPLFYEAFFLSSTLVFKEEVNYFFELMELILKNYQSTCLPLSMANFCKRLPLGSFLEQLEHHPLSMAALNFFASIANHRILVSDPNHLQILLEMIKKALSVDQVNGSQLDLLIECYMPLFKSFKDRYQEPLSVVLDRQMQGILSHKDYEKIISWLKHRKELNLELKVNYSFKSHLQAATLLIQKQNFKCAYELLRFIPETCSSIGEVENEWESLLVLLSDNPFSMDCAQVLIDYSLFDSLSLKYSALIKKIIQKLLKAPQDKQSKRKKVLNQAFNLLERFCFSDGVLWYQFISKIHKESVKLSCMDQIINCLVVHQQKIDFKENTAKFWNLVFQLLSFEGHSQLFNLIEKLDLNEIYKFKEKDQAKLYASTYQALAKAILKSYEKKDQQDREKAFIQFLNHRNGRLVFQEALKSPKDLKLARHLGIVFSHLIKVKYPYYEEFISAEICLYLIKFFQKIDLQLAKVQTCCDHTAIILYLAKLDKMDLKSRRRIITTSLAILFQNDFKNCLQEDIKIVFTGLIEFLIKNEDLKTLQVLKKFAEQTPEFDRKVLLNLDLMIDRLTFGFPSIPRIPYLQSFRNQLLEIKHIERRISYLKIPEEKDKYERLFSYKKSLQLKICQQGCTAITLISGLAITALTYNSFYQNNYL